MEWLSYEVWQRLSNNMPVYFAYYAGIMLNAFGYLLCFLLCRHNWPGPIVNTSYKITQQLQLIFQFIGNEF